MRRKDKKQETFPVAFTSNLIRCSLEKPWFSLSLSLSLALSGEGELMEGLTAAEGLVVGGIQHESCPTPIPLVQPTSCVSLGGVAR